MEENTEHTSTGPGGGADTSTGASYDPMKDPNRKAKSKDLGWKYGYWPDLTNKNIVRCNLCQRDTTSGIKRLMQHLAGGFGDIGKCPKVTPEISKEMLEALLSKQKKKLSTLLNEDNQDIQEEDMHYNEGEEATVGNQSEEIGSGGTSGTGRSQTSIRAPVPSSGTSARKRKIVLPQVRGPMDAHVRRTPEDVVVERHGKGKYQITIESQTRSLEEKKKVDTAIADWFYSSGISFNACKSVDFEVMLEAVAQYGSGYIPPSYHELSVTLLQSATERISEMKRRHENYWRQYRCTLMFDGWTDQRGRHLINFLANSPEGTFFLGSIDASKHIQDANMLFQLLDNKVEDIGEDYVIQVVTDNTANYKVAGKLLMEKRKKLYWTPCAAHCLDLMLEDIGNIKSYRIVIVKARNVTKFIYRHTRLLEALRSKTNGHDLVRDGVTRFATSVLTIQSLLQHKDALRALFISEDWKKSPSANTKAGKRVEETIFATVFWNGMQEFFCATKPLLTVLRIVDGDEKPALPELYVAMRKAKQAIKDNFGGKERLWKKIIHIVDKHWETQMDRPLYAAAFFLNPGKYFQFSETVEEDNLVLLDAQMAFNEVILRLVPDIETQNKICTQAEAYRESRLSFSMPMATRQRAILRPISWWKAHAGSCLELKKIAVRILGLCCSSSACERNWSTFEFIHTKRRNRLEHKRLNDLVYIQYNRQLDERFKLRRLEKRNYDPLLLDELDWSSELMVDLGSNDLVHRNEDFRWSDVDRAMGASTSVQGNRPSRMMTYHRRGNGNTSGPSGAADVEVSAGDSSDGEGDMEMDVEDVCDDIDVPEDLDVNVVRTSTTPRQQ